MHQIRFRPGLCPRPRWGAYSALPNPVAGFKGPTSSGGKGRNGRRHEGRERREGKEGREREEGEASGGRTGCTPIKKSWLCP